MSGLKVYIGIILLLAFGLSSCNFLVGTKKDETVEEIFEQGKIDPSLVQNEVGYVPLLPFWTGFSAPIDVFAGYDEMIYVVDENGLHVLDQTGTIHRTIRIKGATDVVQDRRLHTYVAGRIDLEVNGQMEDLAAVYHLINTASDDAVEIVDTLIHPFNDVSRNNIPFRDKDDPCPDAAVRFTGLATLADHTLYIARTGPKNDASSIARPDNAVLFYDKDGVNIGFAKGLSATTSNLKSVINATAIATFAGPPQSLTGISKSPDFLLCLSNMESEYVCQSDIETEYKVLWIKENFDPEGGVIYAENADLTVMDATKADRFLYQPDRFEDPADVYIAPDQTGYIFVVDAGTDSLYQFTPSGYEGVNPPPTSTTKKQVIASFGRIENDATGANEHFQLNDPSGVCYFKKVIYIADKGNNRIARYKLSTDLE